MRTRVVVAVAATLGILIGLTVGVLVAGDGNESAAAPGTTAPATVTTAAGTAAPATSTAVATTTPSVVTDPPPLAEGVWSATFDGNTGADRIRQGVYHRNVGQQELGGPQVIFDGVDNNAWHGGEWTADHDMACDSPDTQRSLRSEMTPGDDMTPTFDFHVDELQFACRDHWMTSVGDVDGYSIVWFSPDAEFTRDSQRTVSWDVNVTYLGGRMWWEMSIVPVGSPFLATVDWMAEVAHIEAYDDASVIVGTGPAGSNINITTHAQQQYGGWAELCSAGAEQDPGGCASKAERKPFSVTDNGDGTITVDYGGLFTETVPGEFPERFEVYFKQHAYTPDKDGPVAGHTYHWDNIVIR